jgi:SSS family solute:Na+ symporter
MALIDYIIIGLYFGFMIALGFWYVKRASKDLESYFLGGRSMHWLALSMSGSVSTFDVTGTMWIVSMLFLMGMKSMWIHWMWGCMMGAFFMAYMGKWVRRSNAITGADWMLTRFGNDLGGRVARTAYALMAIVTQASFIGYAFQGIGKFTAVYLPLSPNACATIIIGGTTLYVLLGGLYSVVVTDVIQTVILTVASVLIAAVAYFHLTPESLSSLPANWFSVAPVWKLGAGTEAAKAGYELFGLLVILWVMKGFLVNAGGPAQMYDFQRFLACRNPRDASKIGASWSAFLIVRWGMAMGIVLLALASMMNVNDPEQVMPKVIHDYIPAGAKGLILAGFLAAFMSTFSSTVNSAASYVVRDIWQPFFKPNATNTQLIRVSHASTIGVVVIGLLIGFQAKSIAQIWNWMMMALGAGVIMPNVLRWYWWRINGWGYAAGTLGGILLSLVALIEPNAPMYVTFPPICAGSLLACIVVSLFTQPVEASVLCSFYRTVCPFGLWKPVKTMVALKGDSSTTREKTPTTKTSGRWSESAWLSVFNTLIGILAVTGLYLSPMYLVGHRHMTAALFFAVTLCACVILAFTWYPNLPRAEETVSAASTFTTPEQSDS